MISKTKLKAIRFLHQKKYREEQKLFIAEGPKVVNALLNSKYRLREIFSTTEFFLPNSKFEIQKISAKELAQISFLTTPNQVLGIFELPVSKLHLEDFKLNLSLALEDIRDPGNLGTIIRIADWFGIKNILCSESCVDLYNPKVMQATMGSIARVNVYYENLESIVSKLGKSIPVYASTMNGKSIYTEQLSSKGVILVGNESKGISPNILKLASHHIAIPGFSSGADSLNAAIAAAVICSEFRRREM